MDSLFPKYFALSGFIKYKLSYAILFAISLKTENFVKSLKSLKKKVC